MRARALALVVSCSLLSTAVACSRASDEREYKLQGQVLSIAASGREANIKHEEIAGFMPAMTMPYKVRDAKEFSELAPGDLINANLVIVSNDAYLKNVRKVGSAPLERPPADVPTASSGFELLKEGENVPNTTFVDQDGKQRTFDSFRGSAVLLTYIYTRCPMPTFCPLMDRNFAAIQTKLHEKKASNVQLVTVSFDPAHDTPEVLKKHAASLKADPRVWTFLTGDRDEVDKFAMRFGVSIQRALDDPANIAHTLRTAIIDRQGRLVKVITGNEWKPDQLLADVEALAGAD
jgi:protein SCO1/2